MTSPDRPGAASGGASGKASQKERLREAVGPILTKAGYDLEELAVSRAGNRSVVRVVVDGEDGVSSDAIADLSRDISAALDEAEAGGSPISPGGYTLEVSSPGVDRPLTLPRHWRRNRGRLVKVRVGQVARTGRVTAVDEAGVTLDVDGEEHTAAYEDLGPGKVQIEFGKPDRPETSKDGSRPGGKPGSRRGKEEA
ncbi:MAG: ribosome maturation factor RimP [Micromonosporaceae bacterium]|nr:ribosome maturation factor RimP [Micromonosporaceae bacterium]